MNFSITVDLRVKNVLVYDEKGNPFRTTPKINFFGNYRFIKGNPANNG
jgi:hypothetical protein